MSEPSSDSANSAPGAPQPDDRASAQATSLAGSSPPKSASKGGPTSPELPNLSGQASQPTVRAAPASRPAGIDLLSDVSLQVRVELGRTRMLVEDVLRLGADSVVELDKAAGDPVDIYVNGRHIARGEVLVLNESFCVRVNEIVEPFQPGEVAEAGAGPTATLRRPVPRGEVA